MTATVEPYFASVDGMNLEELLGWHARDAIVRFGSADPLVGRDVIGESIGEFWTHLSGLRHRVRNVWPVDGAALVEADIDYTLPDGRVITVPGLTVLGGWDGRPGCLTDVRIYVDLAPVFDNNA